MILIRGYRATVTAGGRLLMGIGLGPNAVTLGALVFGLIAGAVFIVTRNPILFALLMLAGAFLDALDGEVARGTGQVTKFGGYLDALCDRAYEAAVILAAAQVTGDWALSMLFLAGSYAVSYTKARAALEAPVSNHGWPQLMGREGRSLGFFVAVLLLGVFPDVLWGGRSLFFWTLAAVNLAIAVTVVQRIRYARTILDATDRRATAS